MTKRLRGIHAAWRFWYAVVFGGESGVRKVGLGGIHPLTRRYVQDEVCKKKLINIMD
ncbi:TPA: DUF3265 domain-containing protein [Vibrio cholerae]|nr:DUF3265 domain-containing protein [Vibrio cholerae]MDV2348021.1 DUF3265 domain-containing protein [Vibrio cholerae]HDZ9141726.1 DUF3265 domain-containing protein [Vibrio cholerae]